MASKYLIYELILYHRGPRGAASGLSTSSPEVRGIAAGPLLLDGKQLVGAKQNRILNMTVLVAAQSEVK
jgi:hypothetical protein